MENSPELREMVVLGSFAFAIGVAVLLFLIGGGLWFHILCIPVILTSYCYRNRGVLLSALVSGICFFLIYIMAPESSGPARLIGEWLVLVVAGGLVSSLSSAISERALRYGSIFEHSGAGVCLISHPDFCITEVNPVFLGIFGYEACELVGSRFAKVWEKSDIRDEFFTTLRAKGEATCQGALCHKKDRSEVEVLFSGRWLSDDLIICTATELSPENKIIDSYDDKYRNTLDSIQEAIHIVDRDLNLVFSNAAHSGLCTEVGISCETGKSLFDLFPTGWGSVEDDYRQVFATGIPHQSEGIYETSSGRVMAEVLKMPLMHEDGVEHVVTVIRDVTAHRDAESALSRSEGLYRTVFETTGTAMMILEADGTVSLSNGEMEKTFGYRPGDVQGKRIWEFFASEADVREVMHYHRNRRNGEGVSPPRTYESRLCDSRGMKRDVVLTVKMIPETERSVLSLLDVTAGKQAERLLRVVKGVNQLIIHEPDTLSLLRKACGRFSGLDQAFVVSVSLRSDGELKIAAISDTRYCIYHESCLASPEMTEVIETKRHTEFHNLMDTDEGVQTHMRTLAVPMLSGGDLLGVLIFTTASPAPLGYEETELLKTLADDLAFAMRSHEIEEQKCVALSQIEQNMKQFAILNDEIRNPLQGIVGLADLEGGKTSEAIIRQAGAIDELVVSLDRHWLESEKIRDYLHKHYNMTDVRDE